MSKELIQTKTIPENETADVLGSGSLPVWATPAMVAFMENTAMQLIESSEGYTSVGIGINAQHLKASAVGDKVQCRAVLTGINEKKYVFSIEVTDHEKNIIGLATHERVIVDIERFMSRLKE